MGKALDKALNTRPKLLGAAAVSLILSYVFASLAIDRGFIWQYVVAIVLLVYGIKYLIRSLKTHGNK